MFKLAKYQWFRRLHGGKWLHSMSCGWFPVTDRECDEYMREMPRYITAIEDNTHDDTILQGALVAVAVASAVIAVGLASGAIPL